ncbi:MAG: DUF429 domain-containing protein [Myxococcota bacterium]
MSRESRPMVFVVGADACPEGWVAVALTNGRFAGASNYTSFAALVDDAADAFAIGVDIPIGLLEEGQRFCDGMVKAQLGPRQRETWATPPRPAVTAATYETADTQMRRLTGMGLPRPTYALHAKILEVEAVVRRQASAEASIAPYFTARQIMTRRESKSALRKYARIIEPDEERQKRLSRARPGGRIIEARPDASFAEMNEGRPLSHDKRSYNGVMMRLRLLERAAIRIPLEMDDIGGVQVEDVLDAAAVAWTTHRYAMQRARSLPSREDWQYDGERAIAIWI